MNTVSSAGTRGGRLGWKVAAVAALVMALSIPAVSAQASPAALTVTPITWNVIGLDSNNVNAGPQRFPVGVRVCNTGTTTATSVSTTFNWDLPHTNAYITLISPATSALPDVLPGAANCRDAYYELNIARDANAQNTTARYTVTASATGTTASTPTPRELYVEKLVSQGRNNVDAITGGGGVGDPAPTTVYVGQSYTYKMFSDTSTTYPQLETFLNFTSGIFRIDSVTQTYDNPGGASTSVYEDACGYQSDPTGANYRKCVGPENIPGGKVGGNFVTTYHVTVVGTGTTTVAGTIYDFSGSSYHYNSDFGTGVNSVTVTASYPPADLSMADRKSVV